MNIAVQNVCFSYNSHPLLQDVSLNVQQGQVVSIVGPNGAGKSTLLKCMARLLKPQAGAVHLDGRDIAGKNSRELAKALGYVPQNTGDVFTFTVLETVLMGRKPHVVWEVGDEDFRVVTQVMHFLGIENLAERPLDQLSGGQKQKVFVARALAQQPAIFLFDEPTSNLDVRHQLEVFATIKQLAANEGRTVIVVVHDLNLAARFSDTMVMLKQGSVYAAGKPAEVITEDNIRDVYHVSVAVMETKYGRYVVPIEPL
ncbi:ABC transporter ATP-binding protein [Sporomusa acidovorans]|uniref:Petrobactin import ATP-binding protein YclP n=1 Tax=Sporomusa acidovorans (strain ATCC 49682 / DSM 3132 / Mol) TaxID=1123286 RepID=A0ABZ3IY87_SPOA4|nr:ABC transporter ATP-binding protein [Sporomusa acidovorans]OZC22200.1 putative siderophore transport system ATP-binding protein YusV [Sporomusa acidovorans DSM 3132]SDE81705.1 iron complex transport system ATP-binding protein [Sporomusa acidovorans]